MSNRNDAASGQSLRLMAHFQSIQQEIASLSFLHFPSSLSGPGRRTTSLASLARAGLAVAGIVLGLSFLIVPEMSMFFIPLALALASSNPFAIRPLVRGISDKHMRRTTHRLARHFNAQAATEDGETIGTEKILKRLDHFRRSLESQPPRTAASILSRFLPSTVGIYLLLWILFLPTEFLLSSRFLGQETPQTVGSLLSQIRDGLNLLDPDPGAVGSGYWSLVRLGGVWFGTQLLLFGFLAYALLLFSVGFQSSFRAKAELYLRPSPQGDTAYGLERRIERSLSRQSRRQTVLARPTGEFPWDVFGWSAIGIWVFVLGIVPAAEALAMADDERLLGVAFNLAVAICGALLILRPMRNWMERVQHPWSGGCQMSWWLSVFGAVLGAFISLFFVSRFIAVMAVVVVGGIRQLRGAMSRYAKDEL